MGFARCVVESSADIAAVISSLQNKDTGAFTGDEWGEEDTRFVFVALLALSLLKSLDTIDVPKAVDYIHSCKNFDGGYGLQPGAESHSGQIYTCVGALSIVKRLDLVDIPRLATWLSERQTSSGGLNGRPEKLPDVCYSWWVMSSMAIIDKLDWIDSEKLTAYIINCQVSSILSCFVYTMLIKDRIQKEEALLIGQETWLTCFILFSELLVSVYWDTKILKLSTLCSKSMVRYKGTSTNLLQVACQNLSLSVFWDILDHHRNENVSCVACTKMVQCMQNP